VGVRGRCYPTIRTSPSTTLYTRRNISLALKAASKRILAAVALGYGTLFSDPRGVCKSISLKTVAIFWTSWSGVIESSSWH
jgi:hypothetical protein